MTGPVNGTIKINNYDVNNKIIIIIIIIIFIIIIIITIIVIIVMTMMMMTMMIIKQQHIIALVTILHSHFGGWSIALHSKILASKEIICCQYLST